MVEFIK